MIKTKVIDHIRHKYDKDIHTRVKVSPDGLACMFEELGLDPILDQITHYKGIPIIVDPNMSARVWIAKKRKYA